MIARKVSFGSVSDAGAQTRSTLTTVVTTQRKLDLDTEQQLTMALDMLERDPTLDVYPLLFPPPDPKGRISDH